MTQRSILTINAGSSSVKFAVFGDADSPERILSGQVERIGNPGAQLVAKQSGQKTEDRQRIEAETHEKAAESIAGYLREHLGDDAITAIGHRIVHGGFHLLKHQIITPEVVAELRRTQPMDMNHLPREIALVETFGKVFPAAKQVACFDTAFHRDLPAVAKVLPIPRELSDTGIRRYGFHGLSYTYLMGRLRELAGDDTANGRVILAHLGAGASMAAVHGGKAIDTTMSFTPIAGLVMATRPGDLDPGLLVYLMREKKMSADQLEDFLTQRCGLLGISQTSGDMRDLVAAREKDARAAEAVAIFCYQAKKYICGFAGALGGVDTIVFAGGIGEHAAQVRAEICAGLEFLGVNLDAELNNKSANVISSEGSRVAIRIIPTDEEIVIVTIVRSIVKERD
jgi:acetate kinase